jgi:hypothetical protein
VLCDAGVVQGRLVTGWGGDLCDHITLFSGTGHGVCACWSLHLPTTPPPPPHALSCALQGVVSLPNVIGGPPFVVWLLCDPSCLCVTAASVTASLFAPRGCRHHPGSHGPPVSVTRGLHAHRGPEDLPVPAVRPALSCPQSVPGSTCVDATDRSPPPVGVHLHPEHVCLCVCLLAPPAPSSTTPSPTPSSL